MVSESTGIEGDADDGVEPQTGEVDWVDPMVEDLKPSTKETVRQRKTRVYG